MKKRIPIPRVRMNKELSTEPSIVEEAVSMPQSIYEGIKYDVYKREVEYSDSEDSVNTSIEDNPTVDTIDGYPEVQVWSIFQRKDTPDVDGFDNQDGNPLLYAFKGENNWHFKTNKDRNKFIYLFEHITSKFLDQCKADITIVVPSGGTLNSMIAGTIKRQRKDAKIINNLLRKLTISEVWETIDELDSPFRQKFGKTRHEWEIASKDIKDSFRKMQKYRDGKFTYHFLPTNEPYREYITQSLVCDEWSRGRYAGDIYKHDILLLDDSISRGQTLKNACEILKTFEPRSITVLTMFSKKK